jgi:predicted ATPase
VECLADVLAAMARNRPMLLVVDDVQWADDITLSFLEYCGRVERWSREPVLLLTTVRSEETTQRLDAWLQQPCVRTVRAEPLGRPDMSRVIAEMLGSVAVPQRLLDIVIDRVDGNPYFAGEYLHLLVADGILDRNASGACRSNRLMWGRPLLSTTRCASPNRWPN